MRISNKKIQIKKLKSAALRTFILASPMMFPNIHASASTSLMVSGHAGVVGQATYGTPPLGTNYSTIRVPVGLIFEARPTDNFSLFLGIDYAYNNYPGPSVYLGQNSTTSSSNSDGTGTPLPFSNSTSGSPYSQQVDKPVLTQAYISYQTPVGLLRAGRMPRHWGLGIWRNAEWTPYASLPSTTDSVAFTADFNAFDITLNYEKYGEGVGGTSADAEANALNVEARLKSDPADASSSGVSQELGISFTKFSHNKSNTSINTLDVYAKFYLTSFYLGAEVLYPTGNTQSPNYQSLGGAQACGTQVNGATSGSLTCVSQKISSLAALLKLKYQFDTDSRSSLAATEKAQKILGTEERKTSNVMGIWAGYASGGNNQFNAPGTTGSNNDITAISMNSNIQPSLLMFNNTLPAVNGMPGGAITNSSFARVDYTYENPSIGAIGAIFVWGMLNNLNQNYNAQNSLCTNTSPSVDPTSPNNVLCVGGDKNLGYEADLTYRYTTLDRVTFGLDAGYWYVGNGWQVYNQSLNHSTYGVRASIATEF
ncbi:hypothetical protein [Silvanigrella aquatica]|uniref:Outer membrane protein beta-barrel domain-containing protein n=1 Tax=Silvanigrella aquatica TaxID=1915309 RepID=A0A1L4CXH5_9BACT|nr:hypothetical protein [Silvanigrella aquatica]APJ02645.1 hypothetical protein AXG55_01335 [Silvanigrella aquatica]